MQLDVMEESPSFYLVADCPFPQVPRVCFKTEWEPLPDWEDVTGTLCKHYTGTLHDRLYDADNDIVLKIACNHRLVLERLWRPRVTSGGVLRADDLEPVDALRVERKR